MKAFHYVPLYMFLVGILLAVFPFLSWLDTQQVVAASETTTGEVLGKETRETCMVLGFLCIDRGYITYGFYDLEENYYRREAEVTYDTYRRSLSGDQIDVRFVPDTPSQSRLEEGETNEFNQRLLLFAGIFFFAGFANAAFMAIDHFSGEQPYTESEF